MPTTTEERVPITTGARATAPDDRRWLTGRISTEVAVLMGAAWYVLFGIGSAVQPPTQESLPLIDGILTAVVLAALAVMVVGLAARRRWGLVASLGAAGLFTGLAVACPATGHHGLAGWWFVQLACAGALVGASGYALRR